FRDIPDDETAAMLGGNAADMYDFDVEALRPLANEFGPTPTQLGQRGPQSQADIEAKWADAKRAGRPWRTGIETWPRAAPAS
ncbi:MAG: amidohydrolase, partial [Candidatus Microthrix parvicella]